jgi:hypothetical protein
MRELQSERFLSMHARRKAGHVCQLRLPQLATHGTVFRSNRAATDAKMAEKKKEPKPLKRRPVGDRRQFLTMMSPDLIKLIKLAAIEDDRPASAVMEEAARQWLERRKSTKKI